MQSSAITWEKYAQNVRKRRRIKIVEKALGAFIGKKKMQIFA